jgi:cell fate (sporulation/competence/biofilm development) regulator YlbF (YheA/YmcA/DUF963 family)
MTDKHNEIYRTAYHLVELLRTCPECTQYANARERLQNDPINKRILQDVRRRQVDFQDNFADDDEVAKQEKFVNDLMMSVSLNPVVNEYLNAEYNFGRIVERLSDIFDQIFPNDGFFDDELEDYSAPTELAEKQPIADNTSYLN